MLPRTFALLGLPNRAPYNPTLRFRNRSFVFAAPLGDFELDDCGAIDVDGAERRIGNEAREPMLAANLVKLLEQIDVLLKLVEELGRQLIFGVGLGPERQRRDLARDFWVELLVRFVCAL